MHLTARHLRHTTCTSTHGDTALQQHSNSCAHATYVAEVPVALRSRGWQCAPLLPTLHVRAGPQSCCPSCATDNLIVYQPRMYACTHECMHVCMYACVFNGRLFNYPWSIRFNYELHLCKCHVEWHRASNVHRKSLVPMFPTCPLFQAAYKKSLSHIVGNDKRVHSQVAAMGTTIQATSLIKLALVQIKHSHMLSNMGWPL